MNAGKLFLIMVCAAIMALTAAWSEPAATRPTVAGASGSLQPWTARLEALKPAEPLAYFELAEEVADVAADAQQRELARHLFALAGMLDTKRLGRSACLAIADLEENAVVKRRLLALASLLASGLD